MIKNSMRGGISIITHRHSVANNKYMSNYDPLMPSIYNIYLDANNLYGWAMSQYLPSGSYEWNNNMSLDNILNTPDNNDIGYIIECDLHIPEELHDYMSCYPPAVENTSFKPSPYMEKIARKFENIPEDKEVKQSKINKLIPNLCNKTKYVLHYRNLKLYVQLGMKVTNIHRVL